MLLMEHLARLAGLSWLACRIQLHSYTVTQFHSYRVTEFNIYRVKQLQSYHDAWLHINNRHGWLTGLTDAGTKVRLGIDAHSKQPETEPDYVAASYIWMITYLV